MKFAGNDRTTPFIDVYRVGLWSDVHRAIGEWKHSPHPHARRRAVRNLAYWVRRSWRRRSYWNGHLAEPTPFPEPLHRCGTGWTRRRALRSLERLAASAGVDLSDWEADRG